MSRKIIHDWEIIPYWYPIEKRRDEPEDIISVLLTKSKWFLLHDWDNTDSLKAVEDDSCEVDDDAHGAGRVAVDVDTLN